jgi:hypothetical protein
LIALKRTSRETPEIKLRVFYFLNCDARELRTFVRYFPPLSLLIDCAPLVRAGVNYRF